MLSCHGVSVCTFHIPMHVFCLLLNIHLFLVLCSTKTFLMITAWLYGYTVDITQYKYSYLLTGMLSLCNLLHSSKLIHVPVPVGSRWTAGCELMIVFIDSTTNAVLIVLDLYEECL